MAPHGILPDPSDPDRLYSLHVEVADGRATKYNLEISTDSGSTWEILSQLPFAPYSAKVSGDGTIWIADRDGRIRITRDLGKTFAIIDPPFQTTSLTLQSIAQSVPPLIAVTDWLRDERQVWVFYRPPDSEFQEGHFYTQASGQPPESGLGYAVTNQGGIPFWEEFQRLGGVPALGYPVSQRFTYQGFITHAFQKAVMQWQPGESRESGVEGRVFFLNVFDELQQAGKDDWLLAYRATPRQLDPSFDAGKTWEEIVRDRLALLDANPAIRDRYFPTLDSPTLDPLVLYGLPTSRVEDMGNHYAIRLQRAVIQQWKVDVPWARAGEVTLANGGDTAKEAGLFPAEAVVPEGPP